MADFYTEERDFERVEIYRFFFFAGVKWQKVYPSARRDASTFYNAVPAPVKEREDFNDEDGMWFDPDTIVNVEVV